MNAASIALFFVAFHMLGDFVTQTHKMATLKFMQPPPSPPQLCSSEDEPYFLFEVSTWWPRFWNAVYYRTLHVLIYVTPFVALAAWTLPCENRWLLLWFALSVFVPHWLIDCRRWPKQHPWPAKSLAVDQSLHALHLAIVFCVFYG